MKDKINEIVGKVESGHLEPNEATSKLFDLFFVVLPKGTLPNNCKGCGRTIEEMGKMTSMCDVSACPNYQVMQYNNG